MWWVPSFSTNAQKGGKRKGGRKKGQLVCPLFVEKTNPEKKGKKRICRENAVLCGKMPREAGSSILFATHRRFVSFCSYEYYILYL
jgi:hypothetical protein